MGVCLNHAWLDREFSCSCCLFVHFAGETQAGGASSSGEAGLSDAEVQKVEEVAFRTAAAEASGKPEEARVIKDAAQPTPRQVLLP